MKMIKPNVIIVLALIIALFASGCTVSQQTVPAPSPVPAPQPVAPSQANSQDIKLTADDFPGYTELSLPETGKKTINDLPEQIRNKLKSRGFESYYLSIIQKPLLTVGASPDENFRQIQASVMTFNNKVGAGDTFNEELQTMQLANTTNVAPLEGIGEKAFFYLLTYKDNNGVSLEQHYVVFLKGKYYAIVSLTATEREDSKELSNLLAQAVKKIEDKLN